MSATVYHGGRLDLALARFGGAREDWLDLSTGINPNAYPVGPLEEQVWQTLPDQDAERRLEVAARQYYKVPETAGLVAANGTQALIELLPKLMTSRQVAIVSPTYGEHEHTWLKAGAHVSLLAKDEPIPMLANTLVIVNPNNPDAQVHSMDELKSLSKSMRQRHGHLIVDEAFCDGMPDASILPTLPDNVLVYRSFGKFFGLAGLRLGFLVGENSIIQQMRHLLGPWSVSGPALEIGRRAFEDREWIENTRTALWDMANLQAKMMKAAGLEIIGINPLFVYARHSRSNEIHSGLSRKHILVRDFPADAERLRFGPCKDEQQLQRLAAALDEIIGGL